MGYQDREQLIVYHLDLCETFVRLAKDSIEYGDWPELQATVRDAETIKKEETCQHSIQ